MADTEHGRYRFSWYSLVGLGFAAVIVGAVMVNYLADAQKRNDALIAQHIGQLKTIFERINESCKITGFRHEKDHIDFLNTISFAGTVVGPMNLLEPQGWDGPYVEESLTMNGVEYQIVVTEQGPYIVPGDGVALSNGQVIGKTLKIRATSDIEALMNSPKGLQSNGQALAAPIPLCPSCSLKN